MSVKRRRRAKRVRRETLPGEVSKLANGTGWAAARCHVFLIQAGYDALNNGAKLLPRMRALMEAQVAHHAVEQKTKQRLSKTAAIVTAARKQLATRMGEPADVPSQTGGAS